MLRRGREGEGSTPREASPPRGVASDPRGADSAPRPELEAVEGRGMLAMSVEKDRFEADSPR